MKITCESCNTRYSIPDEKIRGAGKTFKIRCKSCGEMMTVKGVGEGGDAGASDDAVWYYAVGNDRRGPITREALAGLVQAGEVTAQTYVWQNGMANWSLLESVAELQDLLDAGGALDAGDAAEDNTDTAYMSQADLLAAQAAFAAEAPAAEPEPEPAESAPLGGLFGDEAIPASSVDDADDHPFAALAASAEPAPVAAAPAPAASAPAAEDDDLFNFDVPSPNDDPANVHQRRDSSVLFSLDDLGGGDKKGMSKDEALVTESSGLIDIRAVASSQRKGGNDNPFGDLNTAGLSQPSRANVAAVSVPIVQKKSGGSGPWIAIAAIVLVLGGGGVAWFLMSQNKGEQPPVAQQQQVAPAPTPEPATATVGKTEEPKPEDKKDEAATAAAKAEEPKGEEPKAAEGEEKKDEAAAEAKDGAKEAEPQAAAKKEEDPDKEKARKEREKRLREAKAAQAETKKDDAPKPTPTPTVDNKQNTKDVNNLLKNLQEAKQETKTDTGSNESLPQRLAAPVVQKTVRGSNGKFLACYKKMPPVAGGVTVGTSFTIESSGSVSSARVSNPGGTTPEVQGCIVSALKALNFPKFKDPQMVVNYPLRLQ